MLMLALHMQTYNVDKYDKNHDFKDHNRKQPNVCVFRTPSEKSEIGPLQRHN